MKKVISSFILLFICTYYIIGQNYNNIVNHHFNATHEHGIKIKTNLPFTNSNHMPIISIVGYSYNVNVGATSTLNLQISWYIYNNAFIASTISSSGGSAPSVWLSNENGKVVIFLDQKIYFQRFTISAFAQGMAEKPEYFTGWTVKDEALGGTTQVKVPYKNVFGDKVGIGTEDPQYTLDVNGIIGTNQLLTNSLRVKEDVYVHGVINSTNIQSNALKSVFARLAEGNDSNDGTLLGTYSYSTQPAYAKSFAIEHRFSGEINSSINFYRGGDVLGGTLGISVNNGKEIARFHSNGLDLAGTIRATEVKVETGWADFVFDKDYKLPSLEEVESHINEYKRLPDIPSESQVKEEGVGLAEMQVKLLQKIEELTLYVIELKKENQEIKKQLNKL